MLWLLPVLLLLRMLLLRLLLRFLLLRLLLLVVLVLVLVEQVPLLLPQLVALLELELRVLWMLLMAV